MKCSATGLVTCLLSAILLLLICPSRALMTKSIMRTKQVMADVVLDHKQTAFRVLTGTLWCGRGNRAPDRRHLGSKWQLDSCCRGHDLCSDASPFSVPNGIFQISPCDCDDIFRNCLNQLTSQGDDDATWVKSIYFDILRIPCLPL